MRAPAFSSVLSRFPAPIVISSGISDSNGGVDIEAMDNQARLNYLYARSMVGRELSDPGFLRVRTAWSK
jgi:hypothetical protein